MSEIVKLAGKQEKGGDSALMDDPSHKQLILWPQDGRAIPVFLAAGLRSAIIYQVTTRTAC